MMKAFESFLTLPEQDKRDVFEAAASRLDTLPSGEVTKKDLDKARKAARDIDVNNIKAIVSVMMLREGWDVRNATVVLGLRRRTGPFLLRAIGLGSRVV